MANPPKQWFVPCNQGVASHSAIIIQVQFLVEWSQTTANPWLVFLWSSVSVPRVASLSLRLASYTPLLRGLKGKPKGKLKPF